MAVLRSGGVMMITGGQSLERRVDVAEFIAIAGALGADAMELLREALGP
jgi:hypothetical protein